MKSFRVRVYALPCCERGRPSGKPRNPRVLVRSAADDDEVRALIKRELRLEGRKVVSITTERPATASEQGQLTAYCEMRTR